MPPGAAAATAAPGLADLACVIIPLVICAGVAVGGIMPVMRGKFAVVAVAMFAAALCVSMVLSFCAFALLSLMDDAVVAPQDFTGSAVTTNVVLPVGRFLAKTRFVRSLLVALVQPSLLGVCGIACCLVLLYVRDVLVRIGGDVSILFEHFAIFGSAAGVTQK